MTDTAGGHEGRQLRRLAVDDAVFAVGPDLSVADGTPPTCASSSGSAGSSSSWSRATSCRRRRSGPARSRVLADEVQARLLEILADPTADDSPRSSV